MCLLAQRCDGKLRLRNRSECYFRRANRFTANCMVSPKFIRTHLARNYRAKVKNRQKDPAIILIIIICRLPCVVVDVYRFTFRHACRRNDSESAGVVGELALSSAYASQFWRERERDSELELPVHNRHVRELVGFPSLLSSLARGRSIPGRVITQSTRSRYYDATPTTHPRLLWPAAASWSLLESHRRRFVLAA